METYESQMTECIAIYLWCDGRREGEISKIESAKREVGCNKQTFCSIRWQEIRQNLR